MGSVERESDTPPPLIAPPPHPYPPLFYRTDHTYETALAELETRGSNLEKGDLELGKMTSQLRRAKELLAFCNENLAQVEHDVHDILNDNDGYGEK